MIKISFILPCYNVERYVADCLDSIYSQDMPEDKYEVVCIDDCSTDSTKSIIVDYAMKHPNLIMIDHSQNMSVGAARNSGLSVAKGEYIWFVDPDDIINQNSLRSLVDIIEKFPYEVLFFNFDDVDENLIFLRKDQTYKYISEGCSGQEYFAKYFPMRMNAFGIVWRCLFNTTFLKDHCLQYPVMCKAEDVVFLWEVMLCARHVGSVDNTFYNHRCNPYSVTNKQYSARVAFSDRILRGYNIELMLQNHNVVLLPIIKEDMIQTVRWCANSNLELLSKMSKRELNLYYYEIIKNETAIKGVWSYMNRKSKMLFDVNSGRLFWMIKVRLFCKIQRLKNIRK